MVARFVFRRLTPLAMRAAVQSRVVERICVVVLVRRGVRSRSGRGSWMRLGGRCGGRMRGGGDRRRRFMTNGARRRRLD